MLYFYGEPATAEIVLTNAGSAVVTGKLRVTEEWDLDETRTVWSGKVTLKPAERKTTTIEWMPREIMYGRTLRAEFQPKKGPAAQGMEVFQVADPKDWFRTLVMNGPAYPEAIKANEKDPFTTYNNFDNHFSYAPSGFAYLAPEEEQWVAGQGARFIKKQEMVDTIRRHRANGIRSGGYTISNTGGPAGYELARRHPEWFLRDLKGAFNTVGTPVNPIELAQSITNVAGRCTDWYCLYPDFGDPEVVRYAGEEVARAIKMFGFDGMFFDTCYNIIGAFFNTARGDASDIRLWDGAQLGRGEDLDVLTARCVAEVDRIVRMSIPHAVLWYNHASPRPGWGRAHEAALKHPITGSWVEMQGGQILNSTFPMHAVRSFYEGLVVFRDEYLKHPGYNDPVIGCGSLFNLDPLNYMTKEEFAATRDAWTICNQVGANLIATRFHPICLGHEGWRPMAQFMTRYSGLLWGRDVLPVSKSWKRVNVESNREVWWNECVYERDRKGYRDLLIHVVNSPENETFDLKLTQDPPPATHVEVEVKLANPKKPVKVWALQMYGYGDSNRVPSQVELTPTVEDGKLLVEIPDVEYHTLVVVRESK
ncbi:MAG: hypothetical protein PHR35_20360 [Kiritimatiellae bacterium]|nr:hypothetical protein [Kiritimatiellia bacterium]